MNNNTFKITAMICGTVLGIFLLYQFLFSPYARCVNTGKELKVYPGGWQVKEKEFAMNELKAKCANS
jgi:hypothetical protein|tara:strand:- start:975 stop:1175 length:201 start_codon:yes stop_codon:yes gene_type:complete